LYIKPLSLIYNIQKPIINMEKSVINSRPFWVTVIAILLFVSGIIGIVINFFYLVRFPDIISAPLNMFTILGEFLISVFFIHTASGLILLEEHARRWGVVILIIGVLFKVVIMTIDTMFGKPLLETFFNIYIVIYVISAIYLRTPRVKKAFSMKIT